MGAADTETGAADQAWRDFDASMLSLQSMYATGVSESPDARLAKAKEVALAWGRFRDTFLPNGVAGPQ